MVSKGYDIENELWSSRCRDDVALTYRLSLDIYPTPTGVTMFEVCNF